MSTFAVRPAEAGAAWIACGDTDQLTIGGVVYRARALARMTGAALAERGIERAEIAGVAPVAGLGAPPALEDVEGAPTWTWSESGLANFRAARAAEVKAEAERRILAIMAEYEQRNALALGLELTTTHGPDPSTWPADDQATYAAVMAKWAQIKAIRAASDTIEAALPTDAAGLAAFDAAAAADWPA